MKISYSEIQDFKMCRRLWDYADQQRYAPTAPNFHTIFGSALHYGLEALYGFVPVSAQTAFGAWLRMEFDAQESMRGEDARRFGDLYALGCSMLHAYEEWEATDPLVLIQSEIPFALDIPGTDGVLKGVIDAFAEDPDGDLWIVEWKTRGKFPDPDQLAYDEQSSLYQWAFQQMLDRDVYTDLSGKQLRGVVSTTLRKVTVEPPVLISKGKKLSQDKSTPMLYEVYHSAILEHGFALDDYREFLYHLSRQPHPLFRRDRYERTIDELQVIERNLQSVYTSMKAAQVYPTFSFQCSRCPFRSPCQVAQGGGDDQYVLNHNYVQRPPRSTQRARLVLPTQEEVKLA